MALGSCATKKSERGQSGDIRKKSRADPCAMTEGFAESDLGYSLIASGLTLAEV